MQYLNLTIVTPEKTVYEAQVERVTVPTGSGEITVLARHIPLITTIDKGALKVIDESGDEKVFAVFGGVMEVMSDSRAVIMADQTEAVDEIDQARAQEAYDRAEQAMNEKTEEIDSDQYEMVQKQLQKHLNRINVAKKWRK